MADRRPALTWQVRLAAVLAVILALTGAVTVFVRSSDNDSNSDISAALKGLSSETTRSDSTSTTASPPFVAQDAGFSGVFPVPPQRKELPIQATGVSLKGSLYLSATSDEADAVATATLPLTPVGAAITKGLDGGVDGVVKNTGGTVRSRSMTTYLGLPAEDAVILSPEGAITMRAVFVQRRLFAIYVITPTADTPHPGYDQLLATFKPL